jgi:LysR family glycine cleavage system transcriptional activator
MPVCSPQLIAPHQTLADASDLLEYPLLHDEHREDWALWCEAVGWKRTARAVARCSLIATA